MSSFEENSLERQAMREGFLAEGLEGVEDIDPKELERDLKQLESMIKKRASKEFSWRWVVAAGLFVMVSISVWLLVDGFEAKKQLSYIRESDYQEKTTAPEVQGLIVEDSDEPKKVIEVEVLEEETIALSNTESTISTISKVESKKEEKEGQASQKTQVRLRNPVVYQEDESNRLPVVENYKEITERAEEEIEITSQELVEEVTFSDSESIKTELKILQYSGATTRRARKSNQKPLTEQGTRFAKKKYTITSSITKTNQVSGKVIDESGEPLPGAIIRFNNREDEIISNIDGEFEIESTDSTLVANVYFIGYENKEQMIRVNHENIIEMKSDVIALENVMIVDNSHGDRSTGLVANKKEFQKYLQDSLRYPDEAKQTGIEGVVKLKVKIDESGLIESIKITQSLGYGCDQEAMRLIREGAKWQPLIRDGKDKESTVKMKVIFELPDK